MLAGRYAIFPRRKLSIIVAGAMRKARSGYFWKAIKNWFIYLRKHFPRAKIEMLKLLVLTVELAKSMLRPGKFERFPSLLREIKGY